MTILRETTVDGVICPVTVSDESEALLAADAAGRAIIGIWRPAGREEESGSAKPGGMLLLDEQEKDGFKACLYLVTEPEDVTDELLERAARRKLNRPWTIAVTERLIIREFGPDDPLEPVSDYDGDGVFSDWEKREAYRKFQYQLFERGFWALEERSSGRLVGKAGLTGEELGYHIYPAFRGKGYAKEACSAVINYAWQELGLGEICLHVREGNGPSGSLARKLGFQEVQRDGAIRVFRMGKIGEE